MPYPDTTEPKRRDSIYHLTTKILAALRGQAGGTGTSALVVDDGAVASTYAVADIGANASGTIPAGTRSWAFTLDSGTGTFAGGTAKIGRTYAGTTTSAAIPYTTGATSAAQLMTGTKA